MKIGMIGAGKVGFSLGKYFADNGQNITGYYSELKKDAIEAAEFTGSKVYTDLEMIVEDSEMLFLTVPDGVIASVWEQLKRYHICGKIICHCSGALSSEIFSDISKFGSFGFSIHPLFAVSDKYHSYKELSNSYFTIEGSPEKMQETVDLLEQMGNTVCVISKDNKIKYHAAAAICSNLVVGLIHCSETLLRECGFDADAAHQALLPIIEGNISHITNDGVVNALTGPIERNDIDTVQKHLKILKNDTREVYVTVSRQVLKIAKQKHKERDYRKLEEILK